MMLAASRNTREAFCSPSAEITYTEQNPINLILHNYLVP